MNRNLKMHQENVTPVPAITIARISKGTHIALVALQEAIALVGEYPPPSGHIPERVKAVSVHQWRGYAYWEGISSGGARARQRAFKRAFDKLVSTKKVSTWDGWVWISQRRTSLRESPKDGVFAHVRPNAAKHR
jgi:hypothetical protein